MDNRYNMEYNVSNSLRSDIIEILKYEETDDGGAIVNISLSPVVGRALLEEGFVSILKRSLTEETLEFHRKEIENEGSS